jgi:hypothetical protein
MPLEHSASSGAFRRNVGNLMHEVGKSKHVQSPEQALAIAYATKRRAGRSIGGPAMPSMGGSMAMPPPTGVLGPRPMGAPTGMPPGGAGTRPGFAGLGAPPMQPGAPMGGLGALGPNARPPGMADGGAPDDDSSVLPPRWALAGQKNTAPATLSSAGDVAAMGASAADPFGIPSAVAGAVSPSTGKSWRDLEESHPNAALAGSLLTPGGVTKLPGEGLSAVSRLARAYPKTAAVAGGLGMAAGSADAADTGPGERPEAGPDELKQIGDLNKQIAALTQARAKATAGLGPKGAAVQAQTFDSQINALTGQLTDVHKGILDRQTAWDKMKADYDLQTAPFAERHPEEATALRALPALSPIGGAILGGYAGSKIPALKRAATYGAAGLGGALEGAVGAYYPTLADAGMPKGTAAKTQANENNADPSFWEKDIAPEAGFGAALGVLGAKYGMIRRSPKEPAAAPSAPAPAAAPAPSAPTTTTAGKTWPDDPKDIDMYIGKDGTWRERGTGHFIPKRLQPGQQTESQGGAVGFANGGSPLSMPYFAKQEARSLGHVGPVIGSSLGRGDSKSISVPGGSYVLPASHVSALGQGNTLAGHAVINSMFGGGTGPGGASIMRGGHGMGPPRPPRAGGMGFAKGGAPKKGGTVPIYISDGEHVLSPEEVEAVDRFFGGPGDIEHGHKTLDAWVKYEREKHVKTLKKLPGPAK